MADRILALPKVRVPWKEPTLFHLRQLREILAACNSRLPQEGLAVRLPVGAGVRRLELCGLALEGPDGLPDLAVDSPDRGVVELRVRGEAGARGCGPVACGGAEAGRRDQALRGPQPAGGGVPQPAHEQRGHAPHPAATGDRSPAVRDL